MKNWRVVEDSWHLMYKVVVFVVFGRTNDEGRKLWEKNYLRSWPFYSVVYRNRYACLYGHPIAYALCESIETS